MKRLIPLAAAALVAAAILFRPFAAPGGARPGIPAAAARSAAGDASLAAGWSTAPPAALPAARRTLPARAIVYVAGAVVRPGVYALPADARAADALARAGGGRPEADLVAVNLAARVHDGDEIAVPVRGAAPPPAPRSSGRGRSVRGARGCGSRLGDGARGVCDGRTARAKHGRGRRAQRADAPPTDPIDLNRADAATLQTLPGIGPALADRIVAFREANGPFDSPDELLDVSGLSQRRLDDIAPYVVVR